MRAKKRNFFYGTFRKTQIFYFLFLQQPYKLFNVIPAKQLF
jgi:hypothetical protein